MRTFIGTIAIAVVFATPQLASAGDPVAPPATWTVSGFAGLSAGSLTDPSFAWRGGVHRWLSPAASVGLEAGRHRWIPNDGTGGRLTSIEPFRGLSKGGSELQHLAVALRMHAAGVGPHRSAPTLSLGAGVYRQVVRQRFGSFAADDQLHDRLRMGVSLAVGGAATRGIAPGAEMRFEYVDTTPSGSGYFTVSAALFGNR